ncbi:MAG: FimB/Mfa2 family fimbrial subunit [Bacteroidota bacterium]
MKKIFISIFLLIVIAAACKKDRSVSTGDDKDQKVTFKVGFAQNSTGFLSATHTNSLKSNADTGLTNHVSIIHYAVFDASGVILHKITQKSTDAIFGQYTDNLKPGTYTVVVAAGPVNLRVSGSTLNNSFLDQQSDLLWGETFFSKFSITIATTAITNNVALHRITSKVVVNVNDPIPAGVNGLLLTIKNVAVKFDIGTEHPFYDPPNTVISGSYYDSKYQISTSFLYIGPFDVTLTGGSLAEKHIDNITAGPNTLITLNGNLFGGTGSDGNGFKIGIDTAWNIPINKGF